MVSDSDNNDTDSVSQNSDSLEPVYFYEIAIYGHMICYMFNGSLWSVLLLTA